MTSIKKYVSAGLAIIILILVFLLRHMMEEALGMGVNSALNSTSQSVLSISPFLPFARGVEGIVALIGVVSLIFAIYGVLKKRRII